MIFVDTGPWYASVVPWSAEHAAAKTWFTTHQGERLLTTDYVIDETLTLLVARGQKPLAVALGRRLLFGSDVEVVYVQPQDVRAAWYVFHHYQDKDWSFTDCTSKVVMERLGVTTAFAFDHHFRQFGSATVVP